MKALLRTGPLETPEAMKTRKEKVDRMTRARIKRENEKKKDPGAYRKKMREEQQASAGKSARPAPSPEAVRVGTSEPQGQNVCCTIS